ncbi:MAG: hypothetical protein JOZ81_10815 [Chloroflexi bacterium]|nr:hypothetical protein [Chloroflexota bacterium]
MVALAEEAAPAMRAAPVLSWLRQLHAEQDNIRSALRWLIDSGQVEQAQRLGAAIGELWMHRGLLGRAAPGWPSSVHWPAVAPDARCALDWPAWLACSHWSTATAPRRGNF